SGVAQLRRRRRGSTSQAPEARDYTPGLFHLELGPRRRLRNFATLLETSSFGNMERCGWTSSNEQMIAYHDTEWGVPVHDDKQLFGKLVLDGFQAGLSWAIILRKRDAFLKAFDGFDPAKMARYDARRIAKILRDPGIVRNRQKVKS